MNLPNIPLIPYPNSHTIRLFSTFADLPKPSLLMCLYNRLEARKFGLFFKSTGTFFSLQKESACNGIPSK